MLLSLTLGPVAATPLLALYGRQQQCNGQSPQRSHSIQSKQIFFGLWTLTSLLIGGGNAIVSKMSPILSWIRYVTINYYCNQALIRNHYPCLLVEGTLSHPEVDCDPNLSSWLSNLLQLVLGMVIFLSALATICIKSKGLYTLCISAAGLPYSSPTPSKSTIEMRSRRCKTCCTIAASRFTPCPSSAACPFKLRVHALAGIYPSSVLLLRSTDGASACIYR